MTRAIDTQVGGDHYKKLGAYQPWEVLKAWLTPEEYRGYMKGTSIAYLARERDKGGMQDIAKAAHTLDGLIELAEHQPAPAVNEWREAVLDQLAVHCLDAALDEKPADILRLILECAVRMALAPDLSPAALALVARGREEVALTPPR